MTIENKRKILAEAAGLINRGWKYNVPVDEPNLKERFFCRVENFKPDQDWNQLFFVINSVSPGGVENIDVIFKEVLETCMAIEKK